MSLRTRTILTATLFMPMALVGCEDSAADSSADAGSEADAATAAGNGDSESNGSSTESDSDGVSSELGNTGSEGSDEVSDVGGSLETDGQSSTDTAQSEASALADAGVDADAAASSSDEESSSTGDTGLSDDIATSSENTDVGSDPGRDSDTIELDGETIDGETIDATGTSEGTLTDDPTATGDDAGVPTDTTSGGEPNIVTYRNAIMSFAQVHTSILGSSYTNAAFEAFFVEMQTDLNLADNTPPESECESVTVGACTATVCPEADPESDAGAEAPNPVSTQTELQAGGISITGLLVDPIEPEFISILELLGGEPVEGALIGYNTSPLLLDAFWSGAETAHIHVIASDAVPEFNIDFQPPTPIHLTKPLIPTDASDAVVIDSGETLNVSWTNGGLGDVSISLSGPVAGGTRVIVCTAASSDGGVSVDASLLSGLSGSGGLGAYSITQVTGTQGDWNYSVVGEDTTLASALANFED